MTPRRKLATLAAFYFVQGLPYGFQLIALPVYLRAYGMSLTAIGLASALSLPWALKVIWGPAVDSYGSARLGHRRSWILPLQIGLIASTAATAFIEPEGNLLLLVVMVLLMAIFASTMDVAVDGLAIDLLDRNELGYGNIAQVVGFKLGILTGGGLLVWASDRIGWQGIFLSMAAMMTLVLLVTLSFREPPARRGTPEAKPTMLAVLATLRRAMRTPGAVWILLFIATYKLGESMADAMFKPFLYDHGFEASQIGLWLGTWGTLFSLAGSFAGGLLASRIGILRAVALTATLRALAVGGEFWLSLTDPTAAKVIGVIAAEQMFGGSLTTAMFAFMMSRVDRRIGATHYTLLATIEVMGKLSAQWLSGFLADRAGYPALFGLATLLAVAFLPLLIPVRRAGRPATQATPQPG